MGTKGQTHGYYRRDVWVLKDRHRVLQERRVGTKEQTHGYYRRDVWVLKNIHMGTTGETCGY